MNVPCPAAKTRLEVEFIVLISCAESNPSKGFLTLKNIRSVENVEIVNFIVFCEFF